MMETITEAVAQFSLAFLIGGMVFFPSVVAPRVFKTLESEDAGRFLRTLFPGYYTYIIICSAIAGLALMVKGSGWSYPVLLVTLSTFLVSRVLMPKINRYRDQEIAGDEKAGLKFGQLHRLSVVINIAQLFLLLVAFGFLIVA